jgi:hypothetical protein
MTLIALALSAALAGDPDSTKVTVDFENASLSEFVESVSFISQVPIEVDDAARKKIGDLTKLRITVKIKDISVTAAAKLIFGPHGVEVKVVDRSKLLVTASR